MVICQQCFGIPRQFDASHILLVKSWRWNGETFRQSLKQLFSAWWAAGYPVSFAFTLDLGAVTYQQVCLVLWYVRVFTEAYAERLIQVGALLAKAK